jgi:hypothetical protein
MPNAFNTLTNIQWSPKSLLISLATTILGALLAFTFAWVHNTNATVISHEAKIVRVETKLDERTQSIDKAIMEIKGTQVRIEDKLDRVLERRVK